jgi:hypothetical protein
VLPLWPNQLLVTLGATHIALLYRDGFSKKILAQREQAIIQHANGAEYACLHTMALLISELTVATNTHLHISLAADLVKYLVLPATAQGMAQSDRLAYAQAAFREVYGAEVLDWSLQCDYAPPKQAAVCAAIKQSLLDGLLALAHQHQLTLKKLSPFFVDVFNQYRLSMQQSNGLVIIVEHTKLILASLQQGNCTQIRVQALMEDWHMQLDAILARSLLLEDTLTQEAHLFAPSHLTQKIKPIEHWHITPLVRVSRFSKLPAPYAMLEAVR